MFVNHTTVDRGVSRIVAPVLVGGVLSSRKPCSSLALFVVVYEGGVEPKPIVWWTTSVDERSGRRQWTSAVDDGSGRAQWMKAVDERS